MCWHRTHELTVSVEGSLLPGGSHRRCLNMANKMKSAFEESKRYTMRKECEEPAASLRADDTKVAACTS